MREFLYNLATDKDKGFLAGVLKFPLLLLSFVYGLLIRCLILFSRFKISKLDCKVISVGNITLGGTGKTSLVQFISSYLKSQKRKVAVLTRGYKKKITNYDLRLTSYENMGDEPYMLAKNLEDIPVVVDKDRVRGGKKAIREYGVDTVILDDGMQQWKIKKDLEIISIDAANPFGNRYMLPRGILRQPLSSLKFADIFILTKVNLANTDINELKNTLCRFNSKALIFESEHKAVGFYSINSPKELLSKDALKGKDAVLFSGIADPDSFKKLSECCGVRVGLVFKFSDHHNYTEEDLNKIMLSSQEKNIGIIITTEKDAARLSGLQFSSPSPQIFVLRMELAIKDEERFFSRLLSL
ncbi:MAG: tetraacyldisaccharide 4'-kinase [Candidatus Omnitrophica bacterium]|nr:tetraacyldisaccharide 4'-kinase [Candidatus Omnitrophota bacterium]